MPKPKILNSPAILNLSLDLSLKKQLQKHAKKNNVTMSSIVVSLLKEYLKKAEK